MTDREPSVFERIVRRELPANIAFEDERFIVIHDIAPKAALHLLVIPKAHSERLDHLEGADLAALLQTALRVAREHASDYRLLVNVGAGAGQEVMHTHVHILADEGSLRRSD